ncbi:hypothetical protein ACWEK5_03445 [Rhodococcus koreensis]
MVGYFGEMPTCVRRSYPRRLHHLLGADHGYGARNQNAPGAAGTATEGCEFNPYQRTDSMNQGTANRHKEPLDVCGRRPAGGL